jgi:rhamnosyltransferase
MSTLNKCLESIKKQSISDDIEVIIVDSMSTDGSRELALQNRAQLVDIPIEAFNHGLTRNIGVQYATGDLIFLTVQDAWIPDVDMLERMSKHFEDPCVMAVVGHQAVPHEKDKNPLIWYAPYSKPSVTERFIEERERNDFLKLPKLKLQSIIAWDDVVAMYRKTALIQQPFENTEFAEDWIWSYNSLHRGWKLLRDSSLVVYHYHHQSYAYAFRTTYTVNYHFHKYFNFLPDLPPLVLPLLQAIYHLAKNKRLSITERVYWINYNALAKFANFFSTLNFLIRFKLGGIAGIEKGYRKFCKIIPIGKQK